jgi:hypothetical protein
MNFTTKRPVLLVVAVVVVAAVAAPTAAPTFAKKPEGKGKPKTDFTVNAMLFMYPWGVAWEGDCNANGAINDRGYANFGGRTLILNGEMGSIGFEISDDTFNVAWGTEAYADLVATGSAQVSERHGKDYRKMKISLHGTVVSGGP